MIVENFKGSVPENPPTGPTRARGPVTPEGKMIAARNSYRHGLYAKFREFRTREECEEARYFTDGFLESYRPVGVAETAAVFMLAWCHHWTLRINCTTESLWNTDHTLMLQLQDSRGETRNDIRAEQDLLLIHDPRHKRLDRMRRHVTTEFNKATRMLKDLQRERRLREKEEAQQRLESERESRQAENQAVNREASKSLETPVPVDPEFVPATTETLPELNT